MADDKLNTATQPAGIPRIRGERYLECYANQLELRVSPVDIMLVFKQAREIFGQGPGVEDVATIYVSPQHFKQIANTINETIKGYEKYYGPISIRAELAKPKRNADELYERIKSIAEAGGSISSSERKPRAKRSRAVAPK